MSDVIKFISGTTPKEGNAVLRATVGGYSTILEANLPDNPVEMSGYLDTRFDEVTYYTAGP